MGGEMYPAAGSLPFDFAKSWFSRRRYEEILQHLTDGFADSEIVPTLDAI